MTMRKAKVRARVISSGQQLRERAARYERREGFY
jgi:hypothetical protein